MWQREMIRHREKERIGKLVAFGRNVMGETSKRSRPITNVCATRGGEPLKGPLFGSAVTSPPLSPTSPRQRLFLATPVSSPP